MARIVNAAEMARVLKVGSETIRKWRRCGIIPALIINATIRYDVDDVIEALKKITPKNQHQPKGRKNARNTEIE